MSILLKFLKSSKFSIADQKALEMLLRFTFISLLAMSFNIALFWFAELESAAKFVAANALFTMACILGIRLIRSVRFAVHAILFSFVITVVRVTVEFGGIQSGNVFWLVVTPILGSMILGGRHGFAVAFIGSVSAFCLCLYSLVMLPEPRFSFYVQAILSTVTVVGIAFLNLVLTSQFQRMKDSAFAMLDERNQAIERIVNNVKSGFLIVDVDGKVMPGYSKSCYELLQTEELEEQELSQILEQDPRKQEHLSLCWSQVFDDFMPESVTLGQAPSRFELGDHRHVALEGTAVRSAEGTVEGLLFTITDVSQLIAAERENERNKKILEIMKNKEGFLDMLRESRTFLEDLERNHLREKSPLSMRILHTMKGNTASFGLSELAATIHHIEDKPVLAREDIELIRQEIEEFLASVQDVLNVPSLEEVRTTRYMVSEGSLNQLRSELEQKLSPGHPLCGPIQSWLDDIQTLDVRSFLQPMTGQLERISQSIGKDAVLKISGDHSKIGKHFAKFCQHLPNLFRNSLYHGIEDQAERGDKPWPPVLELRVSDLDRAIKLELIDDGRGIDPQRIKAKALESGQRQAADLDAMSEQDLVQLIFDDGVSTEEAVNEIAGRGAGTSAVKADVESLGGRIWVESTVGRGTKFIVEMPKVLSTEAHKASA